MYNPSVILLSSYQYLYRNVNLEISESRIRFAALFRFSIEIIAKNASALNPMARPVPNLRVLRGMV